MEPQFPNRDAKHAKVTAAGIERAGKQWLDALAAAERLSRQSRQSPRDEVLLARWTESRRDVEVAAQRYREM